MNASLEIRDLSAGYGRRRIWEHIDLTASPGEICVLMGKNGSGKTTLLRAIQGSIPSRTGHIRIGGADLAGMSVRQRAAKVTTMPQEIPADKGLLGQDYAEMAFYPARGPFAKLTERDRGKIRLTAEAFGISGLLDRDLAEMSAGERQMISLLRAAVQDTPVLLLDEPVSALDYQHTEMLFHMLQQMAAAGKTILTVLHDPTLALRHGTRLLCLENGRIAADVPVDASSPAMMEAALGILYPGLRVHRDPLFCYTENNNIK